MSEETKDKKSDKEKITEKRCFVMMPFSDQGDYPKGHFTKVYEQIFAPAIIKAGYKPYRVDENTISDSIINKIFEGVQNCEMALCDLSNRNPNVLYELGLRQAYNKPVVLVKDEKTENIFDVSVISTVPYRSDRLYENVLEAQEKICESLKSTGEGKDTTLVQFVRAKEASYDDVKVNKDDTVNIMLQSIMKELQKLNNNEDTYNEYKYTVIISVFNKDNKNWNSIRGIFSFLELEHGIRAVNVTSSMVNHTILIEMYAKDYNENKSIVRHTLQENIGEIISVRNLRNENDIIK